MLKTVIIVLGINIDNVILCIMFYIKKTSKISIMMTVANYELVVRETHLCIHIS